MSGATQEANSVASLSLPACPANITLQKGVMHRPPSHQVILGLMGLRTDHG